MNKYTALYIRVSTNYQDKGAEAQERSLIDFINSREITNYKVYRDIGVSGTKENREQLNIMLNDVKGGLVSTLIVYSFSRYARSTKFLIESLELFNKLNVDFISLSERIDTSSAIGKMVFTVIAALSTFEAQIVSDRVKLGLANSKAKGIKLGRPTTRNDDLIISLRERGYTYKQIREVTGVGHGTITRAIKAHNKKKE